MLCPGMTSFLYSGKIRLFGYLHFAEPLRHRIRERAQKLAKQQGVQIEHVNKAHIRKEDLASEVLAGRGNPPGLVLFLILRYPYNMIFAFPLLSSIAGGLALIYGKALIAHIQQSVRTKYR